MLHLIFKPHREVLRAGASDPQKLFVLLKVIPAAPLATVRPPLALTLVIDTSGSMREPSQRTASGPNGELTESKLERAIAATRALLLHPRLVPGDLISVVQFADTARVVLPLSPLGDGAQARDALETLRGFSGGTQVAPGLRAAQSELARILQGGVAQRVLLLTDGQATDAPACREAASELAEANVPLISIGIGDDYNEELLRDLAEIGRGRPYHLPAIEGLSEVFEAEVQSSVREVVTALRAQVQLVSGVCLDSVTRVYPDLAEIEFNGAPVRVPAVEMSLEADSSASAASAPAPQPQLAGLSLGNIMAGDYTVFVLELTIAGRARPAGRVRLAQVQLSGAVATGTGTVESARQDIVVSFADEATGDGSAGDGNRAAKVDDEVLGYVQQRNVDRLVQGAVRRSTHDLDGAKQSLQSAVEMTRRIGNVRVTRLLQNSLDELGAEGKMSSSTRKTIALETRTRTIKTRAADALADVPGEAEIRRLTGA